MKRSKKSSAKLRCHKFKKGSACKLARDSKGRARCKVTPRGKCKDIPVSSRRKSKFGRKASKSRRSVKKSYKPRKSRRTSKKTRKSRRSRRSRRSSKKTRKSRRSRRSSKKSRRSGKRLSKARKPCHKLKKKSACRMARDKRGMSRCQVTKRGKCKTVRVSNRVMSPYSRQYRTQIVPYGETPDYTVETPNDTVETPAYTVETSDDEEYGFNTPPKVPKFEYNTVETPKTPSWTDVSDESDNSEGVPRLTDTDKGQQLILSPYRAS